MLCVLCANQFESKWPQPSFTYAIRNLNALYLKRMR